jgi:hypothetical protein
MLRPDADYIFHALPSGTFIGRWGDPDAKVLKLVPVRDDSASAVYEALAAGTFPAWADADDALPVPPPEPERWVNSVPGGNYRLTTSGSEEPPSNPLM